jgi:hypothetical protein
MRENEQTYILKWKFHKNLYKLSYFTSILNFEKRIACKISWPSVAFMYDMKTFVHFYAEANLSLVFSIVGR